MHVSRAFKPAAKMNLPLEPGDEPLTATKKERVVILGTGWGGHAISKVMMTDMGFFLVNLFLVFFSMVLWYIDGERGVFVDEKKNSIEAKTNYEHFFGTGHVSCSKQYLS